MRRLQVEISPKDVSAYLMMGGCKPDGALEKRVGELTSAVRAVLRPMRVWRRVPVAAVPGPSSLLLRRLEGCKDAYLVCGTLGAGVDALQRSRSAVSGADALIVQAVGAAFIESWMDEIEGEIAKDLAPGEALLERFSPGFPATYLHFQV